MPCMLWQHSVHPASVVKAFSHIN